MAERSMYTAAALSDMHQRTQRSFEKLLDHCAGFSEDDLSRELDGFGYGSIRMQLHHVIGAERYWVGVLHGLSLWDENDADFASLDALRTFRERVTGDTVAYLESAASDELNTARSMTTWGDKQQDLVPARVLVRILTHAFQHQGQVAAMARLLGRPIPSGLDFPIG